MTGLPLTQRVAKTVGGGIIVLVWEK